MNFIKGRELLKRAADSGLFRLFIGFESVHNQGLKQTGARVKLGLSHGEDLSSDKIQNAIEIIQDFGLEIFGFVVIGFDSDTPDTFQRTLDFFKQTKIIPMVTILSPTPDSPIYRKLASEGRLLPNLSWDQILSEVFIFKHPTMSGKEMLKKRDEILNELYGLIPIMKRVMSAYRNRRSPTVFFSSLFSQLGIRKGIRRA